MHADDAAALLRALDAAPAAIVGWSTGGVVALALALRHPDVAAHLVLEEPPLFAKKDTSFDVVSRIVPIVIAAKLGMRKRAAVAFNRWTYGSGGTGWDEFPAAWRDATVRDADALVAEIDGGTGERALDAERIRSIRHPVTGLVGERTLPYLRRAMDRLQRLLPQMRVVTIARGNHGMHIDNPGDFVAAVADSLAPPQLPGVAAAAIDS